MYIYIYVYIDVVDFCHIADVDGSYGAYVADEYLAIMTMMRLMMILM